jgi:four helix bundle protein
LETKYWLYLLNDSDYIDKNRFEELHTKGDELSKILFSILKTTRIKN